MKHKQNSIHILLAEDDEDDEFLFKELITHLSVSTFLITVQDGEKLMNVLSTYPTIPPPHLIFLDINMPRKNGLECLTEIRSHKRYDNTPVFMFSTSQDEGSVNKAYEIGANLYIPKSQFFSGEKDIIEQLFSIHWKEYISKLPRDQFIFGKVAV